MLKNSEKLGKIEKKFLKNCFVFTGDFLILKKSAQIFKTPYTKGFFCGIMLTKLRLQ